MKHAIYSMILALSLTLSTPAAFAKRGGPDGPLHKALKKLDLTAEQQAKLKEIRVGQKDKIEAAHEKMKAARESLEHSLDNNASDTDIRKKHNDLQAARTQMEGLRFESLLQIRAILTPEQRKKFQDMKEDFKDRRGKKFHDANDDEDNE